MRTLGLELNDAGFTIASSDGTDSHVVDVPDRNGATDWPGFVYVDGAQLSFGRAAEDMWLVHPRRTAHNFWSRLTHEPSSVMVGAKHRSFSELAFYFLRDLVERLKSSSGPFDQVVLALPGSYLKDDATEEEKVGLLLGMTGELKLPLAGLIDMACAALCDPRATGFNPALPVVVVDVTLDAAAFTLLTTDVRLTRRDFLHLPQSGYAQLLKHLTATMGNRFLRHTAFDILEDGRIEQTFFRQTKEFLTTEAPEYRYHINTATRAYEMVAKREQLAADTQTFVTSLVQSLQSFARNSPHGADPCTIALTDRVAQLPGLDARLRAAGFARIFRLPAGAAAAGAARIGAQRMTVPADVADVPVETSVPLGDTRRLIAAQWDARLQKNRETGVRPPPTHAILGGIGHPIGRQPRFTIGLSELGCDLPLPPSFSNAEDCSVPLVNEGGKLWFVDAGPNRGSTAIDRTAPRTPIDAGDRLTVRCGTAAAEILFAHCPSANGSRMD